MGDTRVTVTRRNSAEERRRAWAPVTLRLPRGPKLSSVFDEPTTGGKQ